MYNILPVPIVRKLEAVNGSVMCKIPAPRLKVPPENAPRQPHTDREPNVVSRWYRAARHVWERYQGRFIHFVSLRHFGTHKHQDVGYGRLAGSGAVTCIPL
jgi:hypothetical protein